MATKFTTTEQLFFIDSAVQNSNIILDSLPVDSVYYLLDPNSDGLQQMADILANYSDLNAVHLISHGASGSLQLGNSLISQSTLNDHSAALITIGNALTDTGDILLYGCDVAQGETGQAFIQQFATATRADVAASDDLTGATALGGDWLLEKTVGTIETPTLQSNYADVLALPTASQLFNALLTPVEKSVAGGEQAGMIRTMADFAKAAYHLEASENKVINDISPNADAAATALTTQGWTALNLHPTVSATSVVAGQTVTNGMFNDGFYINGNAAACVERCGDAIVLSFRGTNDYAGKGSFTPNQNDPNDVTHPDYDQWTAMPSYYALLQPLITAFDAYVSANGISKVYVTGHSMGGTMALEYMSHHSGSQYQAVTFGASPFGDTFFFVPFRKDYAPDSRITQIEIAKDTVPMLFDARVGLSVGNTRPGELISFAGNQTLDTPDHISQLLGLGVNYDGRTANHSMDYYRQITDSVDADSWTRILAGTGTQTVLLGGQEIPDSQNPKLTNFIVDGQLSGTNTSVSNGNDQLVSIDFKVIYGGKGDDLLVAGTNSTQLLGGVGNDKLIGNVGNDTLNGGTGIDSMTGGAGNDTYYVDNISDTIIEKIAEGTDTVNSSAVSYTLADNAERLVLVEDSVATNAYGNNLGNTLIGNSNANFLAGGTGADDMRGGAGDDNYYVNNAGDTVTEAAGQGWDNVYSTISYSLAANVDGLILLGTANLDGTGNGDINGLVGNAGNNVLDGGAGADTLIGGAGDDTYIVDNTGDKVYENAGEGYDTVKSSISYTVPDNVEKLELTGTDNINATGNANTNFLYLLGNSGNNSLDGKGGTDFLEGGLGDDTYFYYGHGEIIAEKANQGTDTVNSTAVSYTLADNVERLVLVEGSAATNAYGNNLGNTLIGNSNANFLAGGTGADDMRGGAGDDNYYVNNAGDTVTETTGQGWDTVYSTISYSLAANVDALILLGTANLNGTGNGDLNGLVGNAGNNILDGGAGNDVLAGGEGADTLIGGVGADIINLTETTAATDTVRIAAGDSLVSSFDTVYGFKLGASSISTTGIDQLDLDNTLISANTTGTNGSDSTLGSIKSHSISAGIIRFDNADSFDAATPLTINMSNAAVAAEVISYLQVNITNNDTIAFASEGNTFVFQDNGVNDTLVELVGVTASSLNNTGFNAGAVWIV